MNARIEETGDIALCLALRRTVFIEEQNVSEADELDELDEVSTHLIALETDIPIGTARVTISGGEAKIGRVCVLREARGRGIGAQLIKACLEVARAESAGHAKLGAQTHAIAFYEALGFAAIGPVYDDAGIPHQDMVQPL